MRLTLNSSDLIQDFKDYSKREVHKDTSFIDIASGMKRKGGGGDLKRELLN